MLLKFNYNDNFFRACPNLEFFPWVIEFFSWVLSFLVLEFFFKMSKKRGWKINSSTDDVSVHLLSQTRRLTFKSELYYVVETPDSMFDLEGCNYFSSWHVGVFNKTPMHSVELYIRFHPLQQYVAAAPCWWLARQVIPPKDPY